MKEFNAEAACNNNGSYRKGNKGFAPKQAELVANIEEI